MTHNVPQRRVAGLHQNTSIESVGITDTWEPLEEGLVPYGFTYIPFFRKRRKIYCHTNALLPQARDNSSCINDYPNIVQESIGYIISRVRQTLSFCLFVKPDIESVQIQLLCIPLAVYCCSISETGCNLCAYCGYIPLGTSHPYQLKR